MSDQQMTGAPLIVVLASGPIADGLIAVGTGAGMRVEVVNEAEAVALTASASAVVVASHLPDEIPVLTAALAAGVPYVGLIANRGRGRDVLAALQVSPELRALVHTPAGLDIGSRLPGEIAVAIIAEIISERPRSAGKTDCAAPDVVRATPAQ
jgi:xanthine dehydrogenase accessory factor